MTPNRPQFQTYFIWFFPLKLWKARPNLFTIKGGVWLSFYKINYMSELLPSLLTFSLSCLDLSRIDIFGLFLHLSKWYGPTNHFPYSSCTFKESIAPLEPSLFHLFHQASANSSKFQEIKLAMKAMLSLHVTTIIFHHMKKVLLKEKKKENTKNMGD